jgi:starch phosphorylase
VDESVLVKASKDQSFISNFNSILSSYDSYCYELPHRENIYALEPTDQIAYFCFEFGFHESLPIYSGGLGILAGDHCKAASDLRLPFVGIGLLYRQGYFHQTIDNWGIQQVTYSDSDFEDLPVSPALNDDGSEILIDVALPQR